MTRKRAAHAGIAGKAEAPSRVPVWWDTLTFTHGPETEWFVRSVFARACRSRTTLYWQCAPARASLEARHQQLITAGFRLVLDHRDQPETKRAKERLHRVYVREDGLAIVNREGAEKVSLSVVSLDRGLAERFDRCKKAPRRDAGRVLLRH